MNTIRDLVKELSDGIYHGTTVENLLAIMREGSITPARELSDHRPNYPQSRRSNCYELGAVSCFDFGQASPAKIYDSFEMSKWVPLLLPYHDHSKCEAVVLIGFLCTALDHKPLRYKEIKQRLGNGGIVPHGIECCYPGRMTLAKSHKILFVHFGAGRIMCHYNMCSPKDLSEDVVLRMGLNKDPKSGPA